MASPLTQRWSRNKERNVLIKKFLLNAHKLTWTFSFLLRKFHATFPESFFLASLVLRVVFFSPNWHLRAKSLLRRNISEFRPFLGHFDLNIRNSSTTFRLWMRNLNSEWNARTPQKHFNGTRVHQRTFHFVNKDKPFLISSFFSSKKLCGSLWQRDGKCRLGANGKRPGDGGHNLLHAGVLGEQSFKIYIRLKA